ncbi:MAG: transcription-repair coupling factor [Candidatus Brocadiaceae bacterium]|nr:transcription-repair coupling factor [Candidatus Brocadiaceae bacterium]
MKNILRLIHKDTLYKKAANDLASGKDCHVQGLWGSSAAFLVAGMASDKKLSRKGEILFVTSGIEEAEEVFEDINVFLDQRAIFFPVSEDAISVESQPDNTASVQQTSVLYNLLINNAKSNNRIIVTPIQSLLQHVPSPEAIEKNILTISIGKEYKQEFILDWLTNGGFVRTGIVELPGEFSLRGGIIDIFPFSSMEEDQASDTADSSSVNGTMPFRIEFFGDEVDSIRIFNTETQLSEKEVNSCKVLGVQAGYTYTDPHQNANKHKGKFNSLIDYIPKDSWVVFKEYENIESKAKEINDNLQSHEKIFSLNHLVKSCKDFRKIYLSNLSLKRENIFSFNIKALDHFDHDVDKSIKKIDDVRSSYNNTIIFCSNQAEKQRLSELLSSGVSPLSPSHKTTSGSTKKSKAKHLSSNNTEYQIGHLNHGFLFENISTAFLTHHEIFHRYRLRREPKSLLPSKAIDSFLDLAEGDYVVHASHGIARFLGMQLLNSDSESGSYSEFLMLEFAENAKVYVPATKIELVQKYICGSEHKPKLSKLGNRTWERKKQMAKAAVQDMATELISMQAIREAKQGIVYPQDSEWQRKFESEFIFQETEDQLQALDDIKKDMESLKPMDRLICGDVGYGKTEIAIRAAFKVVTYGKQVAVLVPTTLLAQQHYRTFVERMADYPIEINVLSRFKTRKEQKEILEDLKDGRVDIIIGTHRLVQKDVLFKDIGLIVIDEEQKFGVAHKEKLKKLRESIDVLTLTATPIPRTLHMSLMGIRNISSLKTPPQDRQSIQTSLLRFDSNVIRNAIIHELNRDGQVYFVHNRVKSINRIANTVAKIVPEATLTVAHGQMPEKTLEKKTTDFINRKSDILVSTTIIESGLDIPNVNTIFINEADIFGLSDLHQLRGRVGRYKHRAYAYLLLPENRPITPEAEKRLKAIVDFSELGAGFKIAMRDLEIRGTGNILGIEQHGHIAAVGYEMFCRLLEIVIRKAKNEPVPDYNDVHINLNLESYLPDNYIPDMKLKIEIYRKINRLSSVYEIEEIKEELDDRFGPIPEYTKNLLVESEIRIAAQAANIRSLIRANGTIIIQVENLTKLEPLFNNAKKRIKVVAINELHLTLPRKKMSPYDSADFVKKLLS